MKYRKDIDGLRAIAVLSVIAFHSGIESFSGGFIGVDIFFVISGYLITTLIYRDMQSRCFSFFNFYKRRVSRLLPALSITLVIVLFFGFFLYNGGAFDNLGKEVFYSSFGAANILFAKGQNYFVQDITFRPLLHLWSLGVEEQFYLIWPLLLLLVCKISKKYVLPTAICLFILSLVLSVYAVIESNTKGYFLLHYRAFELFVGVLTSLLAASQERLKLNIKIHKILSYSGLFLIFFPMFILNENSSFPGFNALLPCLGTALLIIFPCQGKVAKLLTCRGFVLIGLVSYPLYLYHHPLISFIHFFEFSLSPISLFFITFSIGAFVAWLTYKYVEQPIRRIVSTSSRLSFVIVVCLSSLMPIFAVTGLIIAKTNGFNIRFDYFNPFAAEITEAHEFTFHENFKSGFQVVDSNHSKALFVGDSLLQQYVLPLMETLNLRTKDIDTVTRGGCVLLKGIDFRDNFDLIPSSILQKRLYDINKTYDYVVISQSWESYDSSVFNFKKSKGFAKWNDLLDNTIDHFLKIAKEVIIIGAHPKVSGTSRIQPHIFKTRTSYDRNLKKLKITNFRSMQDGHDFFKKFDSNANVTVLEPLEIFGMPNSSLRNNKWAYFRDDEHLSSASLAYVTERLKTLILK